MFGGFSTTLRDARPEYELILASGRLGPDSDLLCDHSGGQPYGVVDTVLWSQRVATGCVLRQVKQNQIALRSWLSTQPTNQYKSAIYNYLITANQLNHSGRVWPAEPHACAPQIRALLQHMADLQSGLVPCLVDGSLAVWESHSIVRYLAQILSCIQVCFSAEAGSGA